jgi:hypothetical protein
MSQSIRFVRKGVHGRVSQNFNLPGIIKSRQAVVHISAAEVQRAPDSEVVGPNGQVVKQNFTYHVGDANVWVSNISPHFNDHFPGEPGGVGFVLNVDFPQPIDVAITITVEPQTPFEIQGF